MYAPAESSATRAAATIFAVTREPRLTGEESSVSSVLFSFSDAIVVAIICEAKMITMNKTTGMNVVCCITKPMTSETPAAAVASPRTTCSEKASGSLRSAGSLPGVSAMMSWLLSHRWRHRSTAPSTCDPSAAMTENPLMTA